MRGPVSNSEIIGKFTAFYKNACLLQFSENQTAGLFRSSYLDSTFQITDFLVKLTAVECHQISLQNNKNVQTGFSLIAISSVNHHILPFIPKTKFHFSVSKQKLKSTQHYATDIMPQDQFHPPTQTSVMYPQ